MLRGPFFEGRDKILVLGEALQCEVKNLHRNYFQILEIKEKISEKCKILTKFFVCLRELWGKIL